MEYHITKFKVFPGDLNQFCVKCARCRGRVSTIEDIGTTLLNAPTAMLIHWQFIHSHGVDADDDSDRSETDVSFSLLPLLFSTQETYDQLLYSFQHSTDDFDECLHYDFLCSKEHRGKYRFLEAVKVDMHQASKSTNFQNKKHQ
jgi:hypothetical protein